MMFEDSFAPDLPREKESPPATAQMVQEKRDAVFDALVVFIADANKNDKIAFFTIINKAFVLSFKPQTSMSIEFSAHNANGVLSTVCPDGWSDPSTKITLDQVILHSISVDAIFHQNDLTQDQQFLLEDVLQAAIIEYTTKKYEASLLAREKENQMLRDRQYKSLENALSFIKDI